MSEEEEGGDVCEVCKDETFVEKFCSAIGGDKQCRELTESAGRGDITQEDYYAAVIAKYGREKVAMAMEKALVKERIDSAIKPSTPPKDVATAKAELKQEPVPVGLEKKDAGKVARPAVSDKKVAPEGISEAKEKKEMEARIKEGVPKFKTVLEGMCLPCIGEPASAILSVVKLWFTGKEKEKIEDIVKQMRAGEIMVEDALKEVLKMPGGQDCINSTLADFNKVMENSVDSALKEKPELQQEKKGK